MYDKIKAQMGDSTHGDVSQPSTPSYLCNFEVRDQRLKLAWQVLVRDVSLLNPFNLFAQHWADCMARR